MKNKTKTIKKRRVEIYLPTEQMIDVWKQKAKESKTSLSKFVIENVERNIFNMNNSDIKENRQQLAEQIRELAEENESLRSKLKERENLITYYEKEIRGHRTQTFLSAEHGGIRGYEKDLISLFKTKKQVRKDQILSLLNISISEVETVKSLQLQLKNLEEYNIIKDEGTTWRWIA